MVPFFQQSIREYEFWYMYLLVYREFYTGWLTHWGERNAETGAEFTARELQNILSRNASVVLYVYFLIFLGSSYRVVFDCSYEINRKYLF